MVISLYLSPPFSKILAMPLHLVRLYTVTWWENGKIGQCRSVEVTDQSIQYLHDLSLPAIRWIWQHSDNLSGNFFSWKRPCQHLHSQQSLYKAQHYCQDSWFPSNKAIFILKDEWYVVTHILSISGTVRIYFQYNSDFRNEVTTLTQYTCYSCGRVSPFHCCAAPTC